MLLLLPLTFFFFPVKSSITIAFWGHASVSMWNNSPFFTIRQALCVAPPTPPSPSLNSALIHLVDVIYDHFPVTLNGPGSGTVAVWTHLSQFSFKCLKAHILINMAAQSLIWWSTGQWTVQVCVCLCARLCARERPGKPSTQIYPSHFSECTENSHCSDLKL